MDALAAVATWPVSTAAAAVVHHGEVVASVGDRTAPFALASLTKLMTAMAALVAHEEQTLDLDEPITDAGATVADLLAHAGGVAYEAGPDFTLPRRRRIYSTYAFDLVAAEIERRADMPFSDYLLGALHEPLGMVPTPLTGSAGADAVGSLDDAVRLASAWRAPILIAPSTLQRATTVHHETLDGVLPGFGRQRPNPWGLGPEIRGEKSPHWTGERNSPATYGHFGRAGTMMWIDPAIDVALIALSDRPFGPWSAPAWQSLSDAVIGEITDS